MVYIAGIFEKNLDSGEITKYYNTADGRRLAMRKGATLSYFANDHLGGTALVMDTNGNPVSKIRYFPYGNIWTQETGSPQTDKLFTGQRRYGGKSGIYHYGARFYSADIGRFLSPDTIVPGAENPQALNRYAYVLDNPLKYSDPTGHKWDDGTKGGCTPRTCPKQLGWKPKPRRGAVHTVPLPPRRPPRVTPLSFPTCACPVSNPGSISKDLGVVVVVSGSLAMADSPALPFGDIAGVAVLGVGGSYVVGKHWGDDIGEGMGSGAGKACSWIRLCSDGGDETVEGEEVPSPPVPWPEDATKPPAEGWEWRGKEGSKPGSSEGNWYNPETGESLRLKDLEQHPEPPGPHIDYRARDERWYRWFPDGRMELKR
jgi:RHS repeat-associated protein